MAIDRIGKGGAVPQAPEADGAGRADEARAPFEIEGTRRQGIDPANVERSSTAADPASPLGRLRAGEVDVDGYVDLKVEEVTKGLEGLAPSEIDDIKSVLRDQMKTDPGLADLVRTATGKIPTPPED